MTKDEDDVNGNAARRGVPSVGGSRVSYVVACCLPASEIVARRKSIRGKVEAFRNLLFAQKLPRVLRT